MLALPMDGISVQVVLEVVADFDDLGGASLSLVAWELFVEDERVAAAWEQCWRTDCSSPLAATPPTTSSRGG
jgi:hypothetical protein